MFGGGMIADNLNISPPDEAFEYTLQRLEIAVFNRVAYKLLNDVDVLYGMATELLETDHRGYQAMYTANEMINLITENKTQKAGQLADAFFAEKNGDKVHTLIAMGHCHIDTAWLWTYDETIRKCARSWHSQLQLMKDYPEFVFTCSQAQQFYWIKKYYPEIFTNIKEMVKQGRFIPVGGTWVELDGLLPSGESFIRQFFYGQQFFQKEFGMKCKEFWLPDTFGYSGQIPQILKHVGIDRFLTQKLSWSMVNKFPHHNFIWEGIDGSQVLVHFPPGDSYTMTASVKEILKSVTNSQDKGRVNCGAYLFGHGDGGGGPTMEMLEKLRRVRNVDGLPKVEMGTPDKLFEMLASESRNLCKWVGELYLELHNGTYTSQAKIKWYNRKLEQFLMEVELIMAIAYSTDCALQEEEFRKDLHLVDKCWKRLLLNQFHDVIPGSCIERVKDDAWRIYKCVWSDLTKLQTIYNNKLLFGAADNANVPVIFNPLCWEVTQVICSSSAIPQSVNSTVQTVVLDDKCFDEEEEGRKLPHKFVAVLVKMVPTGYSQVIPVEPSLPVTVRKTTNNNTSLFNMSNGKLNLKVETLNGIPVESLALVSSRQDYNEVEVFKKDTKPGMFYVFDDVPLFWDSWDAMDYHLETRKELECRDTSGPIILADGPLLSAYKWSCTFGSSSNFTRYTIMRADSPILEYFLIIDWKESHKFLKVEFPVDVLAREATYEIQYGHLQRPTHINTSWDMAKFEVSGHKWMDISQADRGVTFITDSKYGWHVRDNVVQLSLLRSPKSPDGNCDMHKHYIHYAILPHEGTFQSAGSIRKAYEFNFFGANDVSILNVDQDYWKRGMTNMVTTDNEAVILEAIKVAYQVNRALCIRMYESFGGSARARVNLGFSATKIEECDGLENPLDESKYVDTDGNSFQIRLNPFQIKSFLVYF
ncbi:alpha-mannosidase 2C1-like isoform X2 [Folsomia candida]|nr:alpha-mannosidase 2C1-like isoform X2 [Folsomia candida]